MTLRTLNSCFRCHTLVIALPCRGLCAACSTHRSHLILMSPGSGFSCAHFADARKGLGPDPRLSRRQRAQASMEDHTDRGAVNVPGSPIQGSYLQAVSRRGQRSPLSTTFLPWDPRPSLGQGHQEVLPPLPPTQLCPPAGLQTAFPPRGKKVKGRQHDSSLASRAFRVVLFTRSQFIFYSKSIRNN